jgi:hypothetical protein
MDLIVMRLLAPDLMSMHNDEEQIQIQLEPRKLALCEPHQTRAPCSPHLTSPQTRKSLDNLPVHDGKIIV